MKANIISNLKDSTVDGNLDVKGYLTFNGENRLRIFNVVTQKTLTSTNSSEDFEITFDPPMKNLDYSLFVGMKNNVNFCTDANAIIVNTFKTLESCTVRLFNDYFGGRMIILPVCNLVLFIE